MSTPDPTPTPPEPTPPEPTPPEPTPPEPTPPGLPPAPWILIDRTTVEQAAVVLERLEQWLAGADPDATADCAHTCSHGEADPFEVAAWAGTLAAHLHHRIDISDTGVDDAGMDDAGMDDAGMDDAGVDDAGMDDAGMDDAGMDDVGMDDAGVDPWP
jgi:hypothetical protein